ncbi:MAG: hypothetical protein BWY64_02836 [bacterium ADurb.Bin363]|nr:MAG: hypothetical protein BWY64_02836 [bacterium ADurb.Bin363]
MDSSLRGFVPSVEEDEFYCLSHCILFPDKLDNLKKFTNDHTEKIRQVLNELKQNQISFDKNILIKETSLPVEIEKIFSLNAKDEKAFDSYAKAINDYWTQIDIIGKVQEFLYSSNKKGGLDYTKIKDLASEILNNYHKYDDSAVILNTHDLSERYRNEMEQRDKGLSQRTTGSKDLDKLLARPFAPQEMTTLFGNKGSGKSLFCKFLENNLITLGVCVISINLEMTDTSNYDRLISMREGISLPDLIKSDKEPRLKSKIENGIKKIEQIKNFLYYKEGEVSLDQLESLIKKSKVIFKELGVLPEDEYCVVTIDLTEQIEELSGKAGTDLKPGINRLLQIAKRSNCHIVNILQSNENIFRGGRMLGTPEACESFSLQPEHVEGGSVYAARSRAVIAVNRPTVLKRRFFPAREEEWDLEPDVMWINVVKQNDAKLGRTAFVFSEDNFRLFPFKRDNTNN